MKEDEGPLKGIVDLLIDWVSDNLALYLLSPQSEVVVPELVAGIQCKNNVRTTSFKSSI